MLYVSVQQQHSGSKQEETWGVCAAPVLHGHGQLALSIIEEPLSTLTWQDTTSHAKFTFKEILKIPFRFTEKVTS